MQKGQMEESWTQKQAQGCHHGKQEMQKLTALWNKTLHLSIPNRASSLTLLLLEDFTWPPGLGYHILDKYKYQLY